MNDNDHIIRLDFYVVFTSTYIVHMKLKRERGYRQSFQEQRNKQQCNTGLYSSNDSLIDQAAGAYLNDLFFRSCYEFTCLYSQMNDLDDRLTKLNDQTY